MAGIGVQWNIVNVKEAVVGPPAVPAVPSVGNITELDGMAITPAKSALGMTDDEGISSITIYSEQTGTTKVQAMATYPENPYPQMLIDRDTIDGNWNADEDWEQQPKTVASATKLWIPHVIGGDSDAPITPAYAVNNTGEVEKFVLDAERRLRQPHRWLHGSVGHPGRGQFKTDGSSWTGWRDQHTTPM